MQSTKLTRSPQLSSILIATFCAVMPVFSGAAVVSTSGSVVLDTTPFPSASDSEIFVFDEMQRVSFVASQVLDAGRIAPGTLVNSHYLQYDPQSPTASVGSGSVTFDGSVLGVIFTTDGLNSDLSPDVTESSDSYFGLASTLGAYPLGADASARGLGSAEDDLVIVIGSEVLLVNSLDIPVAGNIDGFRVLTAVPLPGAIWLLFSSIVAVVSFRARGFRPRSS